MEVATVKEHNLYVVQKQLIYCILLCFCTLYLTSGIIMLWRIFNGDKGVVPRKAAVSEEHTELMSLDI